jgi:solute carrier family 25 folate transporter 32
MTASVVTYPHEVVRTRLQTQRRPLVESSDGLINRLDRGGIVHTTKKLVRTEGWRSLYKGLSVNLIRTVPNSAVTMLTWVPSLFFLLPSVAHTPRQIRVADAAPLPDAFMTLHAVYLISP